MPMAWPVTPAAASDASQTMREATSSGGAERVVAPVLDGDLRARDVVFVDLRVGRDRRGHRRQGGRDDGVGCYAGARKLERPGARHRDETRFRGGVVRLPEAAELAGGRADEDDATALPVLSHRDRGGAPARERPSQMRLDDRVESPSSIFHSTRSRSTPAFATSTSTRPNSASAVRTSSSAVSVGPTGATTATARPPAAWMSVTVCPAVSASTSFTTTAAPAAARASAYARPRLRPAPVTMATLPSRRIGALTCSTSGRARRRTPASCCPRLRTSPGPRAATRRRCP